MRKLMMILLVMGTLAFCTTPVVEARPWHGGYRGWHGGYRGWGGGYRGWNRGWYGRPYWGGYYSPYYSSGYPYYSYPYPVYNSGYYAPYTGYSLWAY